MQLTPQQKRALAETLARHPGWQFTEETGAANCVCGVPIRSDETGHSDHLADVVEKFLDTLPWAQRVEAPAEELRGD